MEHLIKFYPVENADCTLIKLGNGITIIVDCQLFDSLNDEDGNQIRYDVKKGFAERIEQGCQWTSLCGFICKHTSTR